MFDRKLRKLKDKILDPVSGFLSGRIHPLYITAAAFAAGLGTACAVIAGARCAAILLWVLNRVLDGLDGAVARKSRTQSDKGGYFDILTDFIVYAVIPIALFYSDGNPAQWPSLAFLLSSFYVNAASWMYLSAIIEKRHAGGTGTAASSETSVAMPGGIIEGAETIIFYSLFLIFPDYLIHLFGVMGFLTFCSVIMRSVWALKKL